MLRIWKEFLVIYPSYRDYHLRFTVELYAKVIDVNFKFFQKCGQVQALAGCRDTFPILLEFSLSFRFFIVWSQGLKCQLYCSDWDFGHRFFHQRYAITSIEIYALLLSLSLSGQTLKLQIKMPQKLRKFACCLLSAL